MELYSGIDLHAKNHVVGLVDKQGKRILKKRVTNDPELTLNLLEPYREELVGIVVESTYNWYWLVDALMDHGYRVHLANPSANQQYNGLKYRDDNHDAFWLADLLRLGTLKEGYIYPKQERPLRDLVRKRWHLVKLRTSLLISLKNILARQFGIALSASRIKDDSLDTLVSRLPAGEDNLALVIRTSKASIDFLTVQIEAVESAAVKQAKENPSYQNLQGLPGVGKILALTIQQETGDVSRYREVGNYASYCRKVPSKWTSNEKSKGRGNPNNGNKYLAWAFSEAAVHARQSHPASRKFYNRKLNQSNTAVAHNALAHKLTRAAYYILRDHVDFDETKLFR
jgi:transposase